jgi:ABC-type lipopolysaccharide export system ATPase subunit
VSQATEAGGTQVQKHLSHRQHSPDDRAKVMAKNLNLDEAQQAAVAKILEERQQETLRLRRDTSISGSERIARFRALQDQTVLRIRAVLNDEQKKKYDPLAVRKVQPAEDQRSIEDWLKVTTPHQKPE